MLKAKSDPDYKISRFTIIHKDKNQRKVILFNTLTLAVGLFQGKIWKKITDHMHLAESTKYHLFDQGFIVRPEKNETETLFRIFHDRHENSSGLIAKLLPFTNDNSSQSPQLSHKKIINTLTEEVIKRRSTEIHLELLNPETDVQRFDLLNFIKVLENNFQRMHVRFKFSLFLTGPEIRPEILMDLMKHEFSWLNISLPLPDNYANNVSKFEFDCRSLTNFLSTLPENIKTRLQLVHKPGTFDFSGLLQLLNFLKQSGTNKKIHEFMLPKSSSWIKKCQFLHSRLSVQDSGFKEQAAFIIQQFGHRIHPRTPGLGCSQNNKPIIVISPDTGNLSEHCTFQNGYKNIFPENKDYSKIYSHNTNEILLKKCRSTCAFTPICINACSFQHTNELMPVCCNLDYLEDQTRNYLQDCL